MGPQIHLGFGCLNKERKVMEFIEKPNNGKYSKLGYFVFEPEIFNYIKGDEDSLTILLTCKKLQLAAYKHDGFWHAWTSY